MTTFLQTPAFPVAAGMPRAGQFRSYFSANPNVLGVFRFDDPDSLTIVDNKVSTIADWLGGDATFTQPTPGNRATLFADTVLSRKVGAFSKAAVTHYNLVGGEPITASDLWSVVAFHKPSTWQFATVVNIGSSSSIGTSADPYLLTGTGGLSVADHPQSQASWNLQIGTHAAGNTIRQKVGGRSIVSNTGGSVPTGAGAVLGNATGAIAFDGLIDMVMIVRLTDVLADPDNDLLHAIEAFVAERAR